MKIWCKWPLWDNIVLFQCALENKDVSIILRKGGGYPFLFAIVFGVEIPVISSFQSRDEPEGEARLSLSGG